MSDRAKGQSLHYTVQVPIVQAPIVQAPIAPTVGNDPEPLFVHIRPSHPGKWLLMQDDPSTLLDCFPADVFGYIAYSFPAWVTVWLIIIIIILVIIYFFIETAFTFFNLSIFWVLT